MNPITRKHFLQQTSLAGAGLLMSSIKAFASETNEKKVRVAIIGCGSVSTQYLPHLSKSSFVDLVSTCDIIYERAKQTAIKFNIKNSYPHIDALLKGSPFDLLVNLTNMQEHGRLNKQVLQAGRNVWSEKPLANTYNEGKALLDLAKEKKIAHMGCTCCS